MVEERVRCSGSLHRISWTPSGAVAESHLDRKPSGGCANRIQQWQELGVSETEVCTWIDAGFTHPRQAARWTWTGVEPNAATLFETQKVSPEEAAHWLTLGVVGTDAIRWREMGLQPRSLGFLRAEEREAPSADRVSQLAGGGLSALEAVQLLVAADTSGIPLEHLLQLWERIKALPDGYRREQGQGKFLAACFAAAPIEWLEYFTQPGDPKRLDYLGSGAPPSWYAAGIDPYVARRATGEGWSLEDLQEKMQLVREAGQDVCWASIERAHPIDPEEQSREAELAASGLPSEWLGLAKRLRLGPATITAAAHIGLPISVVEPHLAAGTYDPVLIRRWFEIGLSGAAAHRLTECGLSPDDALPWLRAGFLPREVGDFVNRGLTPRTAENPRAGRSWRDAFSRSRGSDSADHFVVRDTELGECAREAVNALVVPRGGSSMMFSSSTATASFLDGGWRSESGYGFGSVSGEWIVGFHALRFVCHRMGLPGPRRLKGEDLVPSAEALEHEFLDGLHRDWAHSLKWAEARPTDVKPMDVATLERAGVDPEEWPKWRELGFDARQAARFHHRGVDWAAELRATGLGPLAIEHIDQDDLDPSIVKAFLDRGVSVRTIPWLLGHGVSPELVQGFRAHGIEAGAVARWVRAGFAAETAGAWDQLGLWPEEARRLRQNGVAPDRNAAERWYETEIAGGKVEAQHALGIIMLTAEEWARAADLLHNAADRGDADSMCALGFLYRYMGNSEQAELWYRRASERDSGALTQLGLVYIDQGRDDLAEPWLREASDSQNEPWAMVELAQLLVRQARPEEAEIFFQRAVQYGRDGRSMLRYAEFLDTQNRHDEAIHWYLMAVDHGEAAAGNYLRNPTETGSPT